MRLTITISLTAIIALLCGPGCASANNSVPTLAKAVTELPSDLSVFELPAK